MDLHTLFKPSERIDIDNGRAITRSVVQQVASADSVVITQPTRRNSEIADETGANVQVLFYRHSGLYSFDAMIEAMAIEDGIPVVTLRSQSEPRKLQRRGGYRLRLSQPVVVRVVNQPIGTPSGNVEFSTSTIDISAGGMFIYGWQNYPIGTIMECAINLGQEYGAVAVRAVVRRCIWPSRQNEPYRIGVKFLDDEETASVKRISEFIFNEQMNVHRLHNGR